MVDLHVGLDEINARLLHDEVVFDAFVVTCNAWQAAKFI
jgi:hypothetical protein